jgi:hypothetical protein
LPGFIDDSRVPNPISRSAGIPPYARLDSIPPGVPLS